MGNIAEEIFEAQFKDACHKHKAAYKGHNQRGYHFTIQGRNPQTSEVRTETITMPDAEAVIYHDAETDLGDYICRIAAWGDTQLQDEGFTEPIDNSAPDTGEQEQG